MHFVKTFFNEILLKEYYRFINKVPDSVSVSDSVIFRDSVSVEIQNLRFGCAL